MKANKLAQEKSPYLLQHAHNPVDWFAWSEEAFAKARAENKPIFLSIGYSTCHWCHVMERESFENDVVAKALNDHFVSIKVDREERPDIDSVYMNYVIATTGRGGWPMSVFLTPDLKPFFGGTYFPPEDRYGMTGFKTLLASIVDAWKRRRDEIVNAAQSASDHLAEHVSLAKPVGATGDILDLAYEQLKETFDIHKGGFGRAPKFPMGHVLSFLLRYWKRTGEAYALRMVEETLTSMGRGGIFDQLGGGFHRYSTDAEWKLPHFEKMLYDQALLVRAYTEAYQATQNPFYEKIARRTLDYVMREMTAAEGGYTCAQDADSLDPENPSHKMEGAFFVWKHSEIQSLLKPRDEEIFTHYYGLTDGGNVEADPHGEFTGKNVLHTVATLDETAARFKLTPKEVADSLTKSAEILFKARDKRNKPHLDDKILADWNGLMITAFALAARTFKDERYAKSASVAANFIHKHMRDKEGRLLHRYRDKEAGIPAFLADIAFLADGLIYLYEATFDEKWLLWSKKLADEIITRFWDEKSGQFFMTAKDGENFLIRPREDHDGAVPAGSSVAARVLLAMHSLTGIEQYAQVAQQAFQSYGALLEARPSGMAQMLCALDAAEGPTSQIVIAGGQNEPELGKMIATIYEGFLPNKVVVLKPLGSEVSAFEKTFELLKDRSVLNGKATAYVCHDRTCELPVSSADALRKQLTDFK